MEYAMRMRATNERGAGPPSPAPSIIREERERCWRSIPDFAPRAPSLPPPLRPASLSHNRPTLRPTRGPLLRLPSRLFGFRGRSLLPAS